MKCPDCGAEVDPQQDFCMDCGEPIAGLKPKVIPFPTQPIPVPVPVPAATPPKAKPRVRRDDDPDPIRCPGCGLPSRKPRCPSCGTRLREEED